MGSGRSGPLGVERNVKEANYILHSLSRLQGHVFCCHFDYRATPAVAVTIWIVLQIITMLRMIATEIQRISDASYNLIQKLNIKCDTIQLKSRLLGMLPKKKPEHHLPLPEMNCIIIEYFKVSSRPKSFTNHIQLNFLSMLQILFIGGRAAITTYKSPPINQFEVLLLPLFSNYRNGRYYGNFLVVISVALCRYAAGSETRFTGRWNLLSNQTVIITAKCCWYNTTTTTENCKIPK